MGPVERYQQAHVRLAKLYERGRASEEKLRKAERDIIKKLHQLGEEEQEAVRPSLVQLVRKYNRGSESFYEKLYGI